MMTKGIRYSVQYSSGFNKEDTFSSEHIHYKFAIEFKVCSFEAFSHKKVALSLLTKENFLKVQKLHFCIGHK